MSTRLRAALLPTLLLAALPSALAAQGRVVRLPERDRPLAGEAPVVFTVGRAEGADHEMFGTVSAVGFDGDDNLYVLDGQARRVMVYDAAGRFLRQIGRPGEGPGELTWPSSLAVAPDGTVMVRHRPGVAVFGSDGRYVETRGIGEWRGRSVEGMEWHPGGGALAVVSRMQTSFEPGIHRAPAVLVHFPPRGAEPVRVFDLPQVWTSESTDDGRGRRTMRSSGPPVFAAQPAFGVLPDGGIAMSFTNGYTVRIVGLDGTTHRYLQRPMRVRLTTEALREQARQRSREAMGAGGSSISSSGGSATRTSGPDRATIEALVASMQFSDTVAAIRAIRVAPSGTIWVERTSASYYDPGPIDLITGAGEYRGTLGGVLLPAAISRGGLAAYIEKDDDDVERVVVRRLPGEWR